MIGLLSFPLSTPQLGGIEAPAFGGRQYRKAPASVCCESHMSIDGVVIK
jgi:hypothetical protein